MNRTERNALVVENLPLVGYLVSEIWARATHLSRDDLASAGAVGLITAADSFDPTLGVPFGAYARRRILGAFADEMRSADWATRTIRHRIREVLLSQETLTAGLGRTPSVDEMASALGVDRNTAAEAMADATRSISSLDDSESDLLAAEISTPEDSLLTKERGGMVRAAVDALPEKMRHIVHEIYFNERTVKELAEELGLTHSAVSQQRSEGIRLLRDGLETHYADDSAEKPAVVSRVAESRRSAYLARLAQSAGLDLARAHDADRRWEPAAS
ncbi:MAG: polymerase sigma factor FliA [Actinomycetota bacterium]|nr:flagellar biosynthesis protein FliA [Glaciihabitans sp.]MDQ1561401.1 polymerase sigma factor FliA [Actinomycetota bacterium]